jgi:hypothetical protein
MLPLLNEGQHSGLSSEQPIIGTSNRPPNAKGTMVYCGIPHVPTSSDWPV